MVGSLREVPKNANIVTHLAHRRWWGLFSGDTYTDKDGELFEHDHGRRAVAAQVRVQTTKGEDFPLTVGVYGRSIEHKSK